jgi:hypothetical protein
VGVYAIEAYVIFKVSCARTFCMFACAQRLFAHRWEKLSGGEVLSDTSCTKISFIRSVQYISGNTHIDVKQTLLPVQGHLHIASDRLKPSISGSLKLRSKKAVFLVLLEFLNVLPLLGDEHTFRTVVVLG